MSDIELHHYKRAIDIVSEEQDWRGLVIQIAKTNPDVLLHAYASTETSQYINDLEFKGYLVEGKKVNAIKRLRYLTGFGLKESKDIVDKLSKDLGEN